MVVIRSFRQIINKSGADNPRGLCHCDPVDWRLGGGKFGDIIGEIGKERLILRCADVMHLAPDRPRQHGILRGITRGDHLIPGIARNRHCIQLLDNRRFWSRRVGQQDNLAASRPIGLQCRHSGRKRGFAVVQAAP